MKYKLLKRLTRHLAPPAHLVALLLAVVAIDGAWAEAPTATAVWEAGEFNKTKNGYSIDLNDNETDSNGNIVIANNASSGVLVTGVNSENVSVLIKYSSFSSASDAVFATFNGTGGGNQVDQGIYDKGSSTAATYYSYSTTLSKPYSFDSPAPTIPGSGVALCTRIKTGNFLYVGATIKSLSGKYKANGTFTMNIQNIAIGGPSGKVTSDSTMKACAGMVIEKVAIFSGNAYSNTDLADYVWPSAEKYRKWAYANNTYTWVPSKDSSDIGSSDNGTLYQFDVASGEDTSTTFASGSDNWRQFCIGQTQYSAPGCALRFTSSSANKTFTGGFSPFTFGGIIVESDAGGLSIGTANDKRTTVFGAASGATETWFRFDADASVIRSGAFRFSGNVNLDIANGKTLSLAAAGSPAIVASVNDNKMATTAGGTLRVHGGGKLTATLNASGAALDFSDQPVASASTASAYIQGVLTVDDDTTFTFPEGATFPYFVATSISGALNPANGYKANANGSISQVTPTELNITSAEPVDLPTTWTSSDDAVVNVSAGINATLTVTAAATLSTITFNVPATSTLTISGAAIAASSIYFPQPGVVKVSATGALVGTAKGPGVLQYNGVLPTITSGISFSNAAWTGTMWLKDFGSLNSNNRANSSLTADMPNWGNSESKVKFTNVKAYTNDSNLTCSYTLVLEDGTGSEEYAWRSDNGYQNYTLTVAKLSGSGTFYDHSGPAATFTFNSFDGFTGKFDITSSGHQIKVPAGATLTVAQDSSIRFAGQEMLGTLNIAENKTLTAVSDDALGYNATGTVNVYGTLAMESYRWTLGQNNHINIYGGGTITGNSDTSNGTFDMNIKGGATIHACGSGSATLACPIQCRLTGGEGSAADGVGKIEVDEGMTLTCSGRIYGDYKVAKTGSGTLVLTYNGSDSYTFPLVQAGAVELGGSQAWNVGTLRDFAGLAGYIVGAGSSVAITQTKEEYGSGVTTVTGIDSSITSITVNKLDGTTVTITPSDGTGALAETAVVSGSTICNHDYEFDNAWTDTGSDKKNATTWDSSDPNFLRDGETSNWSVYTAVCPGNDSKFNLSGDWSAAIRCTVPQKANGIIVAFGNKSSFVALAAGETANTARLVKGGGDNVQVTELATMSVAHATTAMHVYAFVKTANAVDIYCDGNLVTRYNGAIGDLSDGFQFGSVRNGIPTGCGLVRLYNSEKATGGNVDYMRIYNFAIDANMIAKLHNDHPYESPSSTFERTLAGESELEWSATDAWTKGSETADEPEADGIVELTATADSSIAANLATASLYETLTFNGAGAITVTKVANAATLSAVDVIVETDTTVAADAVDFSAARVEVATGKTLTFDFSNIPINSETRRNIVRLTGVSAAPSDLSDTTTWPVQVITHSDAQSLSDYHVSELTYDAGSLAYYYTYGLDHDIGGDVYYTGGYWSNASGNTISVTNAYGAVTKVFSGDTVVIPAYLTGGQSSTAYFDATLPENVTKIRIEKDYAFEPGVTSEILGGTTITVTTGCTLTFGATYRGLTLGAMTMNGSGTIKMGSSGSNETWLNGAVTGNATVTIDSGKTLKVGGSASIANSLAGSGTLWFYSLPSSALSLGDWTGTVDLPEFSAATSGVNLNNYGKSGSTIALRGMTGGWLTSPYTELAMTLRLDGDMNMTGFSPRAYSFAKITGTGDLVYGTSTSPTSIAITEVSGYSGTIVNNTDKTLTIATLALGDGATVDPGTPLLSIGGSGAVSVTAVTVGGAAADFEWEYDDECVFVKTPINRHAGYMDGTTAVITNTAATVAIPESAKGVTFYPTTSSFAFTGGTGLLGGLEDIAIKSKYEGGEQNIFGIFSLDPITYTFSLNARASLTVGEEVVSVTPALAAEAPFGVAEEKPSFSVKTIPGLWYSLESCDSATGSFTAESTVQATGTTTSLNATATPNPVKYYKLGVDVAAPAE